MGDETSTEDLIKELISSNKELVSSVATLKKDVTALKTKDKQREKRPRDDEVEDSSATRDGGRQDYRDSDIEATASEDELSESKRFKLSEEGEAFLETVFSSRLEYATRKAKVTKYGQPDSKWTMCPELSPVVAATLSKEAVKNDKVAFRTQQLWMEATGPLTACLERAHEGELTVQDAIPMIQAALLLMGDAAQNHAALRRKAVLQHLNPQLQSLMKETDFKGAQPYLFGENFAEQAKSKLEAAAALKKSVYPSLRGKSGFRGGHSRRNWGRQGGRANNYGPGRSKKEPAASSSKAEKTVK